jgi:hypothetical protein
MIGRITPSDLTIDDFRHFEGYHSNAEFLVYNALKKILVTKDWHIHYSLNLNENVHLRNPQGSDIDFLVINEEYGFMCIEVKGSSVRMNEGDFQQFNHASGTWVNTKDPFGQIKANHASMMKLFKQYKDIRKRPLFSWCVIFPESTEFNSTEYYESSYCLRDQFKHDFTSFIEARMAWTKQDIMDKMNIVTERLSAYDVKLISNRLRPQVTDDRPDNIINMYTVDMIDELTRKQYHVLDSLSKNERFLIEGSAGTGKTFLAKEIFNRKVVNERIRCLFLCNSEPFSISLRHFFEESIDLNENPIISMNEIHKHLRSSNEHVLLENYINYMLQGKNKYDALVIDEFQDIISFSGMELIIDSVLDRGFKEGSWFFFGDLTRQATNVDLEAVREKFDGLQIFTYYLDINCRNTFNIHQYLRFHTNLEDSNLKSNQILGVDPVHLFYKDDKERNDKLAEKIKLLTESGHKEYNITILYGNDEQKNKLKELDLKIYDLGREPDSYLDMKGVTYSSIKEFQGLENDIIFIYGLPDMEESESIKILYIAISRARYKLFILIDVNNKELIRKFTRQVVQT